MPKHNKDLECAQYRVQICRDLRIKLLNKRQAMSVKKGTYVSLEKTIISILIEHFTNSSD
jgi:hypothetical protein